MTSNKQTSRPCPDASRCGDEVWEYVSDPYDTQV
jgi:hypothetical protein